MNILYFVNQYPKISHTFIKREILGLEFLGYSVKRVSLRAGQETLVDVGDIEESSKTQYLVDGSKAFLLSSFFYSFFGAPFVFLNVLFRYVIQSAGANASLFKRLVFFVEACALKRISDVSDIDHIHTHFGTNSASVTMIARKLGGAKYSFTVHGPEEFDDPSGLILGAKIKEADFVVAISEFCRSQLWRWCEYEDWHKVKIVHCSVDDQLLNSPLPIPTNRIVSIGRLCEQKGQMILLKAIKELKQEGIDVQLDLIGGGELKEPLEQYCNDYDLLANVKFHGWLSGDQIKEVIDGSCGLVLPSFAEGLPVVIMEAYARNRPVISTYIAAIPELVKPKENGWLVYPGDALGLKSSIKELLAANQDEIFEMGRAGYLAVKERHNNIAEARKLAAYISEG